jgi:hypothetical protein
MRAVACGRLGAVKVLLDCSADVGAKSSNVSGVRGVSSPRYTHTLSQPSWWLWQGVCEEE